MIFSSMLESVSTQLHRAERISHSKEFRPLCLQASTTTDLHSMCRIQARFHPQTFYRRKSFGTKVSDTHTATLSSSTRQLSRPEAPENLQHSGCVISRSLRKPNQGSQDRTSRGYLVYGKTPKFETPPVVPGLHLHVLNINHCAICQPKVKFQNLSGLILNPDETIRHHTPHTYVNFLSGDIGPCCRELSPQSRPAKGAVGYSI